MLEHARAVEILRAVCPGRFTRSENARFDPITVVSMRFRIKMYDRESDSSREISETRISDSRGLGGRARIERALSLSRDFDDNPLASRSARDSLLAPLLPPAKIKQSSAVSFVKGEARISMPLFHCQWRARARAHL